MQCSKVLAYWCGNVVGSEDPEDRPAFIADSDGDEASYAMASQLRNRGQGLLVSLLALTVLGSASQIWA
jgi:hypothetical protein